MAVNEEWNWLAKYDSIQKVFYKDSETSREVYVVIDLSNKYNSLEMYLSARSHCTKVSNLTVEYVAPTSGNWKQRL